MNKQTKHHPPYIKNNRYYNCPEDRPESFLFQTVPSFISSLYGRKKRQPENKNEWVVQEKPLDQSNDPIITWIGHASFLIQVGGINILTDPIFGDASTFFPRILPPGIALKHLPRIDYVVISHNHRDHCDVTSLKALRKTNPHMTLLVPKGDKQWLEKQALGPTIEHEWWQHYTHQTQEGAITFTFLPAHHWSAQGLFDRNKSLWGSWMISFDPVRVDPLILLRQGFGGQVRTQPVRHSSGGATAGDVYKYHIYFAGDTSYSDHFNHIAQEFSSIHTALMPIAPETPHPWMRKSHMDAQQAVQAFIDLKAHHFVPMHWGTFQFGLDTFHGPIERLQEVWNNQNLAEKKLTIAKVGQRLQLI